MGLHSKEEEEKEMHLLVVSQDDISQFYNLCIKATSGGVKGSDSDDDDNSNRTCWDPVRQWLSLAPLCLSRTMLNKCLQYRDEESPNGKHQTPLHVVVSAVAENSGAPLDIVAAILQALPDEGALAEKSDKQGGVSCLQTSHVVDWTNDEGQTPLHLVCRRAYCESSPHIINMLLEKSSQSARIKDSHGKLALFYLGQEPENGKENEEEQKKKRSLAKQCFDKYSDMELSRDYETNEDSFLREQDLVQVLDAYPSWLKHHALLNRHVQVHLNKAMADPFFTATVFFDLMYLVSIIVILQFIAVDPGSIRTSEVCAIVLVFATVYFFLRNLFHTFLTIRMRGQLPEPTFATVSSLVLVALLIYLITSLLMPKDAMRDEDVFTLTLIIASATSWIQLFAILRQVSIDFALFADGIIAMLPKIFAFLLTLVLCLLSFAQMLLIATYGSNDDEVAALCLSGKASPGEAFGAFCTFGHALLRVYTMSVGEVFEEDFHHSLLAKTLYAIFLMVVAILLANVLAYIIGNEIYRREHHAIRFWTNRFEFILALDKLSCSGPVHFLRKLNLDNERQLRKLWSGLFGVLRNHDLYVHTFKFWRYSMMRLLIVGLVIPVWFLLGLGTAGYMWPPQFREFLFCTPDDALDPGTRTIDEARETTGDVSGAVLSLKSDIDFVKGDVRSLENKLDEVLRLLREQTDIRTPAR